MPEPHDRAAGPPDRLRADLLDLGAPYEFVLAGCDAARAHGLTDRPVRDLTLCTEAPAALGDITRHVRFGLVRRGWAVTPEVEGPLAARLGVRRRDGGPAYPVHLLKERRWRPPVETPGGPVLAAEDLVGLRVRDLHDHGLARDLADVLAAAGRWSWTELESLGRRHAREAFELTELAARLAGAEWFDDRALAAYGLDEDAAVALRDDAQRWIADIAERLLEETPCDPW